MFIKTLSYLLMVYFLLKFLTDSFFFLVSLREVYGVTDPDISSSIMLIIIALLYRFRLSFLSVLTIELKFRYKYELCVFLKKKFTYSEFL